MNKIIKFFTNNSLSNIFSVMGILLTIYYSVFYVPEWQKNIEIQKVENINENLIKSINEIVFNGHELKSSEISDLIKGKELKYNIFYPYSIDELLNQSQERVLDSIFITLKQRQEIYEEISAVRAALSKEKIEKPSPPNKNIDYIRWSIAFIGIMFGLLGGINIYFNNKKLKEQKEESVISDYEDFIQNKIKRTVGVENQVFNILKELDGQIDVQINGQPDYPDFILKVGGDPKFAVEVKYTETDLIPLRTMSNVVRMASRTQMPLILISNAPITPKSEKRMLRFNSRNPQNPVHFMQFEDSENLKEQIEELLKINV